MTEILSWLVHVLRWIVIAIFAVMIGATFLQVVCRYVFQAPLSWSEELSRYCFVWIVFLAAVLGLERGVLLGVDILTRRLPAVLQDPVAIACELLVGGFCVLVAYASVPVIEVNALQNSPAIGLPMSWVYSVIPISMVLMVAVLLLKRTGRSGRAEQAPADMAGIERQTGRVGGRSPSDDKTIPPPLPLPSASLRCRREGRSSRLEFANELAEKERELPSNKPELPYAIALRAEPAT